MSQDKNTEYNQRWSFLDQEFAPWLSLYKNITDYILPRRGYYLERDGKPSDKAVWNDNIINDAATRAIRVMGAGMQGGLSSENRKWFRNGLIDEDFAAWGPVKEWLDTAESVAYRLLSGSNYYTVNHMLYEEQGGFGVGCMFFERDPRSIIRFRLATAGECRFALGDDGRVDTIYRKIPWTAKQIVEAFGEKNCSDAVLQSYKKNPFTYHTIFHVIEPRKDRKRGNLTAQHMPFKSVWFEETEKDKQLRVSGFQTLPAVIPTWSQVRNSPYGLGPGHDILGHVLQLQEMEKASVKGLHRQADPPMAFPAALKDMISLLPGASNYTDIKTKDQMVGPLYQVNMNLKDVEYKISQIEQKIEKTCYNDLFLMIAQGSMGAQPISATEVMERHEEKMLLLGPTVGRQIDDNLSPTIKWVIGVAVEEGLIPPPPEGVTADQLKMEFVGPLAQAQQLIDAQSINTNLALWERVMGLGEEAGMAVNASVNWIELINKMDQVTSLPAGILNAKDQAEAKLAGIMQAMAQQQQAQEMAQGIDMAKNLGQTPTTEGTALGDLKSAVEAF